MLFTKLVSSLCLPETGLTFRIDGIDEKKALSKMSAQLLNDFDDLLVTNGSVKIDHDRLANTCYKSASIIAYMGAKNTDLLDELYKRGIHLFDPASMRIFTNSILWISSSEPSLVPRILENLRLLWDDSASKRMGIYGRPIT